VFSILEIIKEIKEDYSMVFVGDGPDLSSLRKKAAELGLADKIRFTGNIKHEEVVSELISSDIFVFPSLRVEGFPMVLPEAMLCGLPIVANKIGGIPDAIDDSVTGFLINVGDTRMFREQLCGLVKDIELRRKMGAAALIKAQSEFTIDTMVNKYEQIFKEVIKR
jgi:glycosyltransferase involved in cell wall biosynthesis